MTSPPDPAASQDSRSPSTAYSETGGKSDTRVGSTPTETHPTEILSIQPTTSSLPKAIQNGPSQSFSNTQPSVISTSPPSSANVTQSLTSVPASSTIAVEQTSSHTGTNTRIIIPVVLIIVALAVCCAIIWLNRVRRRRSSSREEMTKSIQAQTEGLDVEGRSHSRNRSDEKSGGLMRDLENILAPGSVDEGHSKAAHAASGWSAVQDLAAITRKLDTLEEAIKARVHIRRDKDDWDGRTGVMNSPDGGYGWGLGKKDEKISAVTEQEGVPEPAPAYSRDLS